MIKARYAGLNDTIYFDFLFLATYSKNQIGEGIFIGRYVFDFAIDCRQIIVSASILECLFTFFNSSATVSNEVTKPEALNIETVL